VSLGPPEILVILVIALLVFGPTRLPEVGRQIGKGVRELRNFQSSLRTDLEDVMAEDASEGTEPAPTLPPVTAPPDGTEGVPTTDAAAGESAEAPANEPVPPAPPDPA
jgi:TatA/E family protein of Tat protein translocase